MTRKRRGLRTARGHRLTRSQGFPFLCPVIEQGVRCSRMLTGSDCPEHGDTTPTAAKPQASQATDDVVRRTRELVRPTRLSEVLRRTDNPRKGLTRPIPEAAMPVVELLRRDVTRPGLLPVGAPLRFDGAYLRGDASWPCPMGLHPDSHGRDEPCALPFGAAGEAFSEWWDEQEDAEAATDAV